jgi:hypothetical protein
MPDIFDVTSPRSSNSQYAEYAQFNCTFFFSAYFRLPFIKYLYDYHLRKLDFFKSKLAVFEKQ